MALDPVAQRAEGVSPLPAGATRGSVGKDQSGSAVGGNAHLPTTSVDVAMHAPEAGRVNRGVEQNTNLTGPSIIGDPTYDTEPAGAFDTNQRSQPFDTPDSSARISTDPSHSDWDDQFGSRIDGAGKNSRAIALDQLSTFDMVGEEPQGEGVGENFEGGD